MTRFSPSASRRAFTLIELLVVIAIIGILVSLLMSAVQKARAAAARTSSINNLHQIALAFHLYHDANGLFPDNGTWGGYTGNAATDDVNLSWAYKILPYIEQDAVHNNPGASLQMGVKVYLDPGRSRAQYSTQGTAQGPVTDYACNSQMLAFQANIGITSITDGTSNTMLVGEKSLDPTIHYSPAQGGDWDETIFWGGSGGTGRNGNQLMKDAPGDNFANNWGTPYPIGLFVFCDGHTVSMPYSLSGNPFQAFLTYNSGDATPNLN